MARIISFAAAAAVMVMQCCSLPVYQDEVNARPAKHRLRRAATQRYAHWGALNYTFYTNPNVFLLEDNTIASAQSEPVRNNTQWDTLYAEQLIGASEAQRTLLKVGSGPFWVQDELFPTPPEPFSDLTVNAHLLQKEIPPFAGSIGVLFDVSVDNMFRSRGRGWTNSVQPCFRAMARLGGATSEGVCSPQGGSTRCVAKVPIPIAWHEQSREGAVTDIAISYVLFPASSLGSCGPSPGNSISSSREVADQSPPSGGEAEGGESAAGTPKEVGSVTLLGWEGNMSAVEEDQYVGLYVPTRRVGIGERFIIPITISSLYLDGDCTIKAKARSGITAIAVRSTGQDQWHTLSMVKQKGTFAMVTAQGLGSTLMEGVATESPEQANPLVFVMEFEVLNDTAPSRVINWRVDCNLRGEARASRFGTDVPVSENWIQAVVPMAPERSITNTAILTGQEVTVNLDIGVVTFLGDVMDAAGHARCTSTDSNILKVRRNCASVYVSGEETSGSERVGVQVSLQGHTAMILFSVYVPELPLRVALSDSKLSTVRGWKVESGRQDEGILEPEKMLNGDGESSKKNTCRLKYQDSKVQVYTRFYAPNANSMFRPDGKRSYLFGESMDLSITYLIRNQLTVMDPTIARVEGTKIVANMPGNTKVQVYHPRTRAILGESPLTVAADKVNIANLRVTLVSGMVLQVNDVAGQGSKVKQATTTAMSDLFVEHQEALLDALVIYDDGTSLALHDINPSDYTVSITTLHPEVVLESPDSMQAYPGLIAMGEGSTSVVLEIALPKPCMKRRRSSTITHKIISVNVSFDNPKYAGLVKTDLSPPPSGPASLWRSLTKAPGLVDYGIVRMNLDLTETGGGKKDSSVISSIPIDIDFNDFFPMGGGGGDGNGQRETRTVPPSLDGDEGASSQDAGKLSGIEIGMYVLLGVFSLAILAFMINCIMFMAKYRRTKGVPKNPPYPQNWVMFGMHEEAHPRISLDPAENIPLRRKEEEEEGSSRDEAIGTESEVSVERHSGDEPPRLPHEGALRVEETSMTQAPPQAALRDSQEADCGVVMDCDCIEEGSLEGLDAPCPNSEGATQEHNDAERSGPPTVNTHLPTVAHVTIPSPGGRSPPALNSNQSNGSCDVKLTLNPSEDNTHVKSRLDGMEYSQILSYLDNLKESCT